MFEVLIQLAIIIGFGVAAIWGFAWVLRIALRIFKGNDGTKKSPGE